MLKKFKRRQYYPKLEKHYKKGDMVMLYHKGYQYRPAKVLSIVKEGRRKWSTTAQMLDMNVKLKRNYSQFVLVKKDSFLQWLVRPSYPFFNKLEKIFRI
tara:strand:+ start:605 stop:901 length:297 start_codon:yes stop_codon:yes gene_type:complete